MANLLKLTEVAQRLDVSEKTVRRYVKAGVLPSAFIGNAYRVSEEDVEEYLRRARVEIGAASPKAPAPPSLAEEPQAARRTLEEQRPFSRLHLLVSIMERDTKRWRQAVTSGSVNLGMVEEASAHQTDMSEELLRVVEEADRERWSVAELGLLRRVLFEEAWPTWKQAGEELLKALIASYTDDELAAVRRRRAEAQQAVSATQEALDRVTGA